MREQRHAAWCTPAGTVRGRGCRAEWAPEGSAQGRRSGSTPAGTARGRGCRAEWAPEGSAQGRRSGSTPAGTARGRGAVRRTAVLPREGLLDRLLVEEALDRHEGGADPAGELGGRADGDLQRAGG